AWKLFLSGAAKFGQHIVQVRTSDHHLQNVALVGVSQLCRQPLMSIDSATYPPVAAHVTDVEQVASILAIMPAYADFGLYIADKLREWQLCAKRRGIGGVNCIQPGSSHAPRLGHTRKVLPVRVIEAHPPLFIRNPHKAWNSE